MTKAELLQIAKPILFNTEMVKAILEGRKTVTRRCVKYKYSNTEMKMWTDKYGTRLIEIQKDVEGETFGRNTDGSTWHKLLPFIEKAPPFKKGDILYIRETWSEWTDGYVYKAWSEPFPQPGKASVMKWHPSLHMPKEAARIFLKVKDVRVERFRICQKMMLLLRVLVLGMIGVMLGMDGDLHLMTLIVVAIAIHCMLLKIFGTPQLRKQM